MTTTLSTRLSPDIEQSITNFAETTTGKEMKRAADIRRDKIYTVKQFFTLVKKSPDQITVSDVSVWHQWMLNEGKIKRSERPADKDIDKAIEDNAPAKQGLAESTV